MALEDFSGAKADFDRAIILNPGYVDVYAMRAGLRERRGDTAGADADIAIANQLGPANRLALLENTFILKHRGDFAGALSLLTNGLNSVKPSGARYADIGFLEFSLHDDPAAVQRLRKALDMDPTITYARFFLWLARVRQGAPAEASRELREQLALHPAPRGRPWESSIGKYLAGDLLETNLFTEATTAARRPTDLDGQMSEACYYAGMKHLFAGDKTGAGQLFEQCVALDMNWHVEYADAKVELRELKK